MNERKGRLFDAWGQPIYNGAEETLHRATREGLRYAIAPTDDLADAFEHVLKARAAGIRNVAILSPPCMCGECPPIALADRASAVKPASRRQEFFEALPAEMVN